jgi:hypothetical protein
MRATQSIQEILEILSAREAPPLAPVKVFDSALTDAIDRLEASDAVKTGLHLLNDDLGRSHEIAQAHEGDRTYDYWHAIVHRREGDFGNSKYWLRRVGEHPVLLGIHDGPTAALRFVDRCRHAAPQDREELEGAQKQEITALIDYAQSKTAR